MTSTVTIDQTTQTTTETPAKKAAVIALATVGFVALLLIGVTLAIYSARYVPLAISRITNGSSNTNNPNSLAVVSSSSTIPFANDGSDVLTATTTTTALMPPGSSMTAGVSNAPVTQGYTPPVQTTPAAPKHVAPYGLPDLSVSIIATGYLSGPSTASFVPANIIPPGARPAVEFSVADVGTNVTGPWNFLAHIPSINDTVFNSPIEPSLNPGDHTVFTLGFNEAIPGQSQPINITVDPNNQIQESSKANNSATASVTITETGD